MKISVPPHYFIKSMNIHTGISLLHNHIHNTFDLNYLIYQLTNKHNFKVNIYWFLEKINKYASTHT